MEPLTLLRAWMWDLHRMGWMVPPAAAREAERVMRAAQDAGAPPGAGLALARDVLRREASLTGRGGQ
jgi:hypothetical protein